MKSKITKSFHKFVILLVFSLITSIAFGQNVIEVPEPQYPQKYHNLVNRAGQLSKIGSPSRGIRFLEDALKGKLSQYERYATIADLAYTYAEAGNYEKSLDTLKKGHQEGFFFNARMDNNNIRPRYLEGLQKLDDFNVWFQENTRRKTQAQKNTKTEYFVQTPSGYSEDKKYPLLIVFHGGVDCNINTFFYWQSPKLKSGYIVAYMQGSRIQGSFLRRFEQGWKDDVKQAYKQITQKYSVDITRVLVAGPSAGGAMSVIIGQDQIIPAAGLILAFPVKPREFNENKLKDAARQGLRLAMIAGENDWAITQQKEMGAVFDKIDLPNRFVIFKELGHQYPTDFPAQIDISLDYIWNKSMKSSN